MNGRRCRLLVISGVLACLAGCSAVGDSARAKSDSGVHLRLCTDRKEFKLGEPIWITAELENKSENDVKIPDLNFWEQHWPPPNPLIVPTPTTTSMTVLHVRPKLATFTWCATDAPSGSLACYPDLLEVPAGGIVRKRFRLSAVVCNGGVPEPGEYEIWARYRGVTPGKEWELVSNAINVRVSREHGSPIRIGLSCGTPRPRRGEPIALTIEFHNDSDATVFLPPFHPGNWPEHRAGRKWKGRDEAPEEAAEREHAIAVSPREAADMLAGSESVTEVIVWRQVDESFGTARCLRPEEGEPCALSVPAHGVHRFQFVSRPEGTAHLRVGEHRVHVIYRAKTPTMELDLASNIVEVLMLIDDDLGSQRP